MKLIKLRKDGIKTKFIILNINITLKYVAHMSVILFQCG